jgi:hypothetical protein
MIMNTLFYVSFIALGSLVTVMPCSQIRVTTGGGPPNGQIPNTVSTNAIKELQLAYFLENLKVSFFNVGLINLMSWGTNGYSNGIIETIRKVAAVSMLFISISKPLSDSLIAKRGPPSNPC